MQSIFIPGINIINKLKYPQKFTLVAVALSLFIMFLLLGLVWGLNRGIDFTEKQRTGLIYIDSVKDLLQDVERHRGLVNGYLHGDKKLIDEMEEIKKSITEQIEKIKKLNRENNDVLKIHQDIKKINQNWDDLEDKALELTPKKSFKEHSYIIAKILELIRNVSDRSNLTMEIEIDKYYLSRSIEWTIPELTDRIGKVRGLGVGIAAEKRITDEEKKSMLVQSAFIGETYAEINENIHRIIKTNPSLSKTLNKFHIDLENSVKEFISITNQEIIEAKSITTDPKEFFELGTGAIRSAFRMYDIEILVLDRLLEKRIEDLKRIKWLVIFPTLLLLLGLAYIFSCFSLSVVNAVKYLKDKAMRVAEGDLTVRSELNTHDELKDLSDSINRMIFNLKALINREEIIRNIVLGALDARTTEETMKGIVVNTGKIFNADRCFFLEYDFEEDVYLPIESHNAYRSSLEVTDVIGYQPLKTEMQPFTDFLFAQQKILAVDNISILDVPEESKKFLKRFNVKPFMAAPVFYSAKPIGILIVEREGNEPGTFKQEEIDLLASIAGQVSILLNQSRLKEEIFRLNEELKASLNAEKILRKIASEANALNTHEEIDNYLINQLLDIFDADKVFHLHVEENRLNWRVKETRGSPPESSEGKCFVPLKSAYEIIPTSEEIITINDVEADLHDELLKDCFKKEGVASLIVYPTSKKIPAYAEKSVIELTMIAKTVTKKWTLEEKNLFKIIMDTVSIVTLETMQRLELEETKKTFIATLTHDLRSPLFAEQKALEYLLSPQYELKRETCQEYFKEMYRTNEEILKLVNNLMAVYHYEAGRVELNKMPENIEQVIKEAAQSMKFLAEDYECSVLFDIQEDLPAVNMDKTEINRVLINLISNAIKHNPKGTAINIKSKKFNNSIRVSIQDNGSGISEEIIPEIFQRYPLKKRKIGTGLGLYISKQVVETHGGKIWFETEKGKGTTFHFTLPL